MRTRWLVTTALLLLPAATAAEQFDSGVRSQLGWTDNVYGNPEESDQDLVDDYSMRLSTWGQVSDTEGDATWSLRYQPSYEFYLQESALRNLDHDANADLAWRIGDRTTLVFSEAYKDYSSAVRFNESTGDPTDPAVLRTGQTDVVGSFTNVGLRHSLTPRDLLTLNGSYTLRTYDDEFGSDRHTFVVASSYTHSLSERTMIGARGSWLRQSFARSVGDDFVTDYYNISGTLDYNFSRTLRLELSGGPTLIDSNSELINFVPRYGVRGSGNALAAVDAQNCQRLANPTQPLNEDEASPNYNPRVTRLGFLDCSFNTADTAVSRGELDLLGYPRGDPLVPGSTTNQTAKLTEFGEPYEIDSSGTLTSLDDSSFGDSEVTYFARAALIKDWEHWRAELAYDRSADSSGSFGAGSVQDSFRLSLRWEPARLWTIHLSGAYIMIEQTSDLAIPKLAIVENEPAPAGVDSVGEIAAVQRLISDVDDDAVSAATTSVSLSARRQLTRRSAVTASLFWYGQDQKREGEDTFLFVPGVSGSDDRDTRWSTLTLRVGLEWYFDTFKF